MSKILIIEDDMTINGLLRSIIEKSGYSVDSAYNGTDGLVMGLREDYNLILMGEDYLQEDNTMNVHISNLRRKIAKYTNQKYIETVYGMGYRLIK